jgi:hypothetical protein
MCLAAGAAAVAGQRGAVTPTSLQDLLLAAWCSERWASCWPPRYHFCLACCLSVPSIHFSISISGPLAVQHMHLCICTAFRVYDTCAHRVVVALSLSSIPLSPARLARLACDVAGVVSLPAHLLLVCCCFGCCRSVRRC